MRMFLQLETLQIAPILGLLWQSQVDSTDAVCGLFLSFTCKQKLNSKCNWRNSPRFCSKIYQLGELMQQEYDEAFWEMRDERIRSVFFLLWFSWRVIVRLWLWENDCERMIVREWSWESDFSAVSFFFFLLAAKKMIV